MINKLKTNMLAPQSKALAADLVERLMTDETMRAAAVRGIRAQQTPPLDEPPGAA
jgi:hypothetical protein